MGLGGYLAWTAVAREISRQIPQDIKILPCEGQGVTISKMIDSPVFYHNPRIFQKGDPNRVFPLFLNNRAANYCKNDTPLKAYHRGDSHIIEQMCEFYEIYKPELRCEMWFSEQEEAKVGELISELSGDFVTIEPYSKDNYTPNRAYPFEKWQNVVNTLSKDIQVVQLGVDTSPLLDNVVDFRGKTTFREASLVIGNSRLFLSTEGGLVHAATAVDTKSIVIITGYQNPTMVAYPQNININIANHGPCGLKIRCEECSQDASLHNEKEIIDKAATFLV